MKRGYVQCATILLAPASDPAAPGGTVTLALCGSWDHAGVCRWPHRTSAEWFDRTGHVQVVFVAEESDEERVRGLIDRALAGGECAGPDGKLSRWEVSECRAGILNRDEEALARSLGKVSMDQ